jgi:hypothetical protein
MARLKVGIARSLTDTLAKNGKASVYAGFVEQL